MPGAALRRLCSSSPALLPVAGERQEEKEGWEQQAGSGLAVKASRSPPWSWF